MPKSRVAVLPSREPWSYAAMGMALMRWSRACLGITEKEFAAEVRKKLGRRAPITADTIRDYERGTAMPVVDTYFAALELAGFDIQLAIANVLSYPPGRRPRPTFAAARRARSG